MTDEPVDIAQRLAARFTPERLRSSCANTCAFKRCTGKGDRQTYAHRCSHAPDVTRDLGTCSCGAPATVQLLNSRSCVACAPTPPTRGYCIPGGRCYCPPGVSCRGIPADLVDNPEA